MLAQRVAETLLLPVLARAINRPLNEYHVSIVNADGIALKPFLQLFNDLNRLQIPFAVITDSDPYFQSSDNYQKKKKQQNKQLYDQDTDNETQGDEILFPESLITYGRAYDLEQSLSGIKSGAKIFRNLKTLEYDLALTDYFGYLLDTYKEFDADTVAEIEKVVEGEKDQRLKAIRFFKRFSSKKKGVFSQRLANKLDSLVAKHQIDQRTTHGDDKVKWDIFLAPPTYLSDAIKWVTGDCNWD